ncbi:MAG: pitrilysin family protein [bacterium]|nr:pitrilysin family protein [bacterium]
MLRRTTLVLLVAAALGAAAHPAAASGVRLDVVEHTLDNGMRFYLVERHTSPTVAGLIRFQVGSRLEAAGSTGISHFLEHMMFKGTRRIGTTDYEAEAQLLERLDALQARLRDLRRSPEPDKEAIGRTEAAIEALEAEQDRYVVKNELWHLYQRHGGVGLNAGTGQDGTTYRVRLPSNKLELWAALESDRMASPVLREFYSERNVVLEERRLRIDTSADGLLWERFMAAAYIAHSYRLPVIGWPDDVGSFTRSEVEAYFRRFYAPNNAIGVLVGDIDPKSVIPMLERTFGTIPRQAPPDVRVPAEPPQRGERRIVVHFEAEPQLLMGYHIPAVTHPDTYPLKVLAAILANGRTSRFYEQLIDGKRLAVDADAGAGIWKDPGLFLISATPRTPHTVEEVEAALEEELRRLVREPPTAWELEKTRNQIDASAVHSLRSNFGIAYQVAKAVSQTGDWRFIERERELLKAVTAKDILRVARAYLTADNRTVAILLPAQKRNPEKEEVP